MKKLFILISFFTATAVFSQKDKILFSVDNDPVMVSEFKRMYERNLSEIENKNAQNIDDYLNLYIKYKLKIKQAYKLELDTLRTYQNELKEYEKQLITPYIQDKKVLNKLVEDAYFRTKNEIRVSHILISMPQRVQSKDTLEFYKKIVSIRKRILNGESFKKVASEVSEDPSAKQNFGDLGYFSAFKMIYPFENMAYKTKVGEISPPFRTKFGYHILKVKDLRLSKGNIAVAQILITDTTDVGKKKIYQLYKKLQNGQKFADLAKEYSDDKGSAVNGGRLPRFGSGSMIKSFEDVAFALNEKGDYSKPVKTKYGWHIIELLGKYPIPSFKDIKYRLKDKVINSKRAKESERALLNKLEKSYKITTNKPLVKQLENSYRKSFSSQEKHQTLITINDKKIKLQNFLKYIYVREYLPFYQLFKKFKEIEIINYFKSNLKKTNLNYRYDLQEYKDGTLLFDLMKQKIWDKATKDSLGLKNYFTNHKSKYKTDKLDRIRGEVMDDYQSFLELKWIDYLRKNSKVIINKKVLRRFKKNYHQK